MVETAMNSTDTAESMFRSVGDAEVSLDEMLSLACRQGKQDIVELLLESGAKVNYRNKAGNTPLLEACSQGHVNIARLLLDKKADIDAPTETTSDSALTWACTLGNEDIVQLLLEHKARIEHRTRDGCTALMFAALAGHDRVAKLLLGHCAELNVESDSNKDSPLTFACWKGHIKVVELFLVHGANIEHRTKEGFSPLMFAALGGHTEVARLLLEKHAEVNQPSGSNNDIPLTSACWKGHHNVVELLLCYQSNIEHHTKDGCTPLMLAAREGHLTVAQLLLNHNARVNVPSGSENNIPLTLACWKGHKDVVELLLNYKSNIEHQNKAGCTPLMLAAREGHYEATELLLDHGANLNIPSGSNDDTPLTLACWKGHDDVVSLLLERQSSINHQTKTGCTPLMEATREGHISVAKMLLEAGADVETPDNYGQTPFFMACWKGHAEVAALLLDYGANKDCKTKTGITPFFQACRENHVDVVKLLLDYGSNPSTAFPNSRECPLTLAAEKGFSELAQVLLSRSANVECRTKKGCTPLFLTCKEGFKEIAILLTKYGAETESSDYRGVTPLLAAFKNGYVEVVDWLLSQVTHLPSDLECQKALMAPRMSDKDILPRRSKCLELIMKAKKAREQAALKNAQILFEELDAEKEKKELRKKAAQRKKAKRKERKRKGQERGKTTEPHEDEEDYEEEEEVSVIKNTSSRGESPPVPPPPLDHAHSDDDDQPQFKNKNKNKSKNKRPIRSSTQSSSHPAAMLTETQRTNPQSPVQAIAESWEDEETEDEMFVDAPEFPELKGSGGNGTDKTFGNNGSSNKGTSSNSSNEPMTDLTTPSKKTQKTSLKNGNQKNRPPEDNSSNSGSKTSNSSRKSSRAAQVGNRVNQGGNGEPSITGSTHSGEGRGGGASTSEGRKDKRSQTSSEDTSSVGNTKSKSSFSTKWSSRSESPSNSTNRSVSTSSSNTGTRGSYVACVDNDDEECDSWNMQLEPGSSDWTNEGFKSQTTRGSSNHSSSNGKLWTSVSTAGGGGSSSSTSSSTVQSSSTTHAISSSSSNSNTTSNNTTGNKPWHEVSRAITTFQMTVSNSLVGRIIGKKGLKINQIQANSGAQISISRAIPRSIDRLITIKGTERSVKTAQDLIEEALSTPSKDIESTSSTTNTNEKPPVAAFVPTTKPQSNSTVSSSQPTTNPWTQSQFTSTSAWGQKRYSDVVPPVSLLKHSSSQEEAKESAPVNATTATRRTSLPVKIQTPAVVSANQPTPTLSNITCGGILLAGSTAGGGVISKSVSTGNNGGASLLPPPTSTPSTVGPSTETKDTGIKHVATTSNTRTDTPPTNVTRPPRHSVTIGPLPSVKEDEEASEDGCEVPKQKRSLSDPLVLRRPSPIDIMDAKKPPDKQLSTTSEEEPSKSPSSGITSSTSTPLVTVTSPATEPHPPISSSASTDGTVTVSKSTTEGEGDSVSTVPSVGVSIAPQPLTESTTPRTTRTVGIVTPTQSVKLFQHDTTTSVSSSSSEQAAPPTTTVNSNEFLTPPTPGGTFGAIGPPRRNSLPVSTGNHYVEGNSPRKLSYAGIHVNNNQYGSSLGMVPESHSVNQPRGGGGGEYPWSPNQPPPMHMPPHPPAVSPWNNHGGSMEWSRPNFPPLPPPPPSDYERMRSQSWAGLGPSSGGFVGHNHPNHHHPMDYPPTNHFPSQPLAPPPSHNPHMHSQWNKFHSINPNQAPPPFIPRPHSSIGSFQPYPGSGGGSGSNFSNYRNEDAQQRHIEMSNNPQPPHPSNYPSHRFTSNNSSSQPSINETASPMSLRQVLGDLEGEIFSGGTPVMDSLMKDESPSISKRWSMSSVTPTMVGQDPNHIHSSSSSVWNPPHPTLRHSVSSPFQNRQHHDQSTDQPLISDLAASWPIWTTPSANDHALHQSSFPSNKTSPSGSSDNGWSYTCTDLASLMKQLGIEEHIPTLQSQGIDLERLLSMSDTEWRDLLPMGPRVKLMNAINIQLQEGDKIIANESATEKGLFPDNNSGKPSKQSTASTSTTTTANTHKCSPFVQ